MDYKERQELKLERYQELAKRHKEQGESTLNQVRKERECIPLGQPILIGHHSEKGHRNHLNRLNNREGRGYEHLDKAEHYENKAENILNPNSISSDNPEAINLLKEKLRGLEAKREQYKEYNKKARKENKEILPSYVLSNLSQNIKSVKDRIELLSKKQNQETKELTIKDIKIVNNVEDNRTQIFFNDIPREEIRTKLKQNGFKWSPFNRCWQRFLSDWAFRIAQDIIKEV